MKKVLFLSIVFFVFLIGGTLNKTAAMPNPWIDCGGDMSCAADKAGFTFPLSVENSSFRAMDGMIEVTFPLDKKREVTVRKTQKYDGKTDVNGIADISGDYNVYPVNKAITLNNGVIFNVRGKKHKYYVVSFAAETGYYGFYCPKGLKLKDIEYLYKLLAKAEMPNNN